MTALLLRLGEESDSLMAESGGRRTAFEQFFRQHELRALRVAELGLGDRDEALDCVQEAMIRLARRYARRPVEEWKPLFYRILNNQVLDCQRRRVRQRRILGEPQPAGDLPLAADPGSEPEAVHAGEQYRLQLEAAMRALPLRQQQAFVLRAWEGLSTRDTAFAMRCSEGSVKTHYHRALSRLRAVAGADE